MERVDDADSRDVVKVLKLFPFGILMEQRESIFKLLKVERHDGDASQSPSCVSSFLLQADLLLPERNCRRTLEDVRSLHSILFPPTPVRHPVDTPAVVQHILETKRLARWTNSSRGFFRTKNWLLWDSACWRGFPRECSMISGGNVGDGAGVRTDQNQPEIAPEEVGGIVVASVCGTSG
mgnify:CR=1 FL=1